MHAASTLTDLIATRRPTIARLRVYRIPTSTLTLIAVSPATIEQFKDVAIETIDDAPAIAAALDAVVASVPKAEDRPLDVRTALIFETSTGERALRVYQGRFASQGQIDETPCRFEELALHDWLRARFA